MTIPDTECPLRTCPGATLAESTWFLQVFGASGQGTRGVAGKISESWKYTVDSTLLPWVCLEPAQQPWSAGWLGSHRVVSTGKPYISLLERDFFSVAAADSR